MHCVSTNNVMKCIDWPFMLHDRNSNNWFSE